MPIDEHIGYKYRTPLRALELSYIVAHLATPGLTTKPIFSWSSALGSTGYNITVSPFSCFVRYTDNTDPFDKGEHLVKVVKSTSDTCNIDINAVAIGLRFDYFDSEGTTPAPTTDQKAVLEQLTIGTVVNYPGVVIATVSWEEKPNEPNVWLPHVSTNGADFSLVYLLANGINPDCWVSLRSPRSGDTDYYKKIEVRNSSEALNVNRNFYLSFEGQGSAATTAKAVLHQVPNLVSSDITSGLAANTNYLVLISNGELKIEALTAQASTEGNFTPSSFDYTGEVVGHFSTYGITTLYGSKEEFGLQAASPNTSGGGFVDTVYHSTPHYNEFIRSLFSSGTQYQYLMTDHQIPSNTNSPLVPRWREGEHSSIKDWCKEADRQQSPVEHTELDKRQLISKEGLHQTIKAYTSDAGSVLQSGREVDDFVTESTLSDTLPKLNDGHGYSSSSTYYAPTGKGGSTANVLTVSQNASTPAWTSTNNKGAVLKTNASGIPGWTAAPARPAVFIASAQNADPSWLPSSSSTAGHGQILKTDSNGVPVWETAPVTNQVYGASADGSPAWTSEPTVTSITTTSSRKKKKNIREFHQCATDLLQAIRIVSFEYKDQENDEDHIGFIAEDTNALLAGKKHDKMKHAECIALLIKAVQELDDRITRLENEAK